MVFNGELSPYAFAAKRFSDLDLCTHDLQNLISSWLECAKYFNEFGSKLFSGSLAMKFTDFAL